MYFGDAQDGLLLSNGIRTGVAALAVLAELAEVELVDPFHHRAEVFFLVGDEAGFEISAERTLGSHAGSGEICRADKGLFFIGDDRFGVNARAEDALEEIALDERSKSLRKRGPGSVEESHWESKILRYSQLFFIFRSALICE